MHYQGGKRRIGAAIVEHILSEHAPRRVIEPFLGGGGFLLRLLESGYDGEVIAGDYNPNITALFKALRFGWLPPQEVISEAEWNEVMTDAKYEHTALRGFVFFASLLMGRAKRPTYKYLSYEDPRTGLSNWEKQWNQAEKLRDAIRNSDASITLVGGDYKGYEEHLTTRCAVYCDPPYAETGGYGKKGKNDFDNAEFWQVVTDWSSRPGVRVFVSEYTAPEQWKSIWSKRVADNLVNLNATERLAKHGKNVSSTKTERLFALAA